MQTRTDTEGIVFSIIATGASLVSFKSIAVWAFALALAAIFCGIMGLALLRRAAFRRDPWVLSGLAAGVIGLVLGIIRAVAWSSPVVLR